MRNLTLDAFTGMLASRTPTPGGGSAAALSGAIACALGSMVARFSKDEELALKWDGRRSRFLDLVREDCEAYDLVSAVLKIPKEDPSRSVKMQEALGKAAAPPAEGLRLISQFIAELAEFAPKAKGSVASDLAVSAYESEAAARGFMLNVRANTSALKDKAKAAALDSENQALLDQTLEGAQRVRGVLHG